jgi:hypothetical protein
LSSEVTAVAPYRVEHKDNEIIIRFSSDLLSRDEVIDILDCALLQKHARELALSDDEIAELAKEANRSMWERLRPMVEQKIGKRLDCVDD